MQKTTSKYKYEKICSANEKEQRKKEQEEKRRKRMKLYKLDVETALEKMLNDIM
jgi:hypothetical protein